MSFWAPILVRLVFLVRPDVFVRYRRRSVAVMRLRGKAGALGRGVWRNHSTTADPFDFMSLCGMPVGQIGGPGSRADCRACRRLMRRAGLVDEESGR